MSGGRHHTRTTKSYIVRFCRLYGNRDIEPFLVKSATSPGAAIERALEKRWNTGHAGRVEHCPISGKLVWISDEKIRPMLSEYVTISGPMRIEVLDAV